MTLEQIAKKSGKDKARVQQLLDEMSVIGMIEYNWENADRHKQYVLPMFVPGCAEFMMMNKKQTEEHPVIAEFFENMSRLPLEKVTPMVPPGGSGIGMHVIPVEKAIPAQQQSASVEHISHWLRKYQDKYAVGACSCRRQQRMRGEGCGEIAASSGCAARDAARLKGICASASGIWRIILWRQGKAAISIWTKCCGDREGPLYRPGRSDGDPGAGRAERVRAPDYQYRRRGEDLRHLQLRAGRLQRTPDVPAFQYAEYVPLCIPGPRGKREMRGLRKVRGSLSGGRGQTGPEAVRPETVHEARRDRVPESAPPGCGEVGARQMGSGLPGPCEDQLLRDRHIAVQGIRITGTMRRSTVTRPAHHRARPRARRTWRCRAT